ncbi:MAG: alpha/beta fold hydrolase [Promethearchaeota archaeon]
MPKIKVNNINIYYEIHGDGFPFIMIAGMGASLDSWTPALIERISNRFKTIIFDNRGVGKTDKPDIPYSIKMMADDTISLMDALNIKRAHIFGHSMGGCIAQEMILNYPRRVEKLVLCSTDCGGSKAVWPPVEIFQTFEKVHTEVLTLEETIHIAASIFVTEETIKNNPKLIEEEFRRYFKIRIPIYSLKHQGVAKGHFNSYRRLKNINNPTLIMQGKKDIITPLKNADILNKVISGSKVVLFDSAAHNIYYDVPEKFVKTLLDFLK